LRHSICIGCLLLIIWGAFIAGYAQSQEESKIPGKRGNVPDADADILEVTFRLLENKSFIINYVIAGSFLEKYYYGLDLYAYGENRSFASIILGYYEQKRGVFFVDLATMRVKPLPYAIQGSTLTITGLTLADLEDRYAFYARAQTAYEKDKKLVWIDGEPQEGAIRIMFASPSPSPLQTTPATTAPSPSISPGARTVTATPYHAPTIVVAVIAVLGVLFGLVIWRSKPRGEVRARTAAKK